MSLQKFSSPTCVLPLKNLYLLSKLPPPDPILKQPKSKTLLVEDAVVILTCRFETSV